MKFRFKSKYDDSYYFGIVDRVFMSNGVENISFYSNGGIAYNVVDVEWLDDIRADIIKKILE